MSMFSWTRRLTHTEDLFDEADNYDAYSRGFVLLSVLLVVGVISALMVALTMEVRTDRATASIERRLVQATALADAGLTRVIAALKAADERFVTKLLDRSEAVRWRSSGRDVLISLIPETGKVDLNFGDPALVINLLRTVVHDDATADRLVLRLAALRRARQDLETVRGLLDPDERASSLAHDLDAVFTVWTSMRGVDLKHAPAIVLRHLPDLREDEAELLVQARERGAYAELSPFVTRFSSLLGASRPIYRARAEVTVEGVTVRREALLTHNPATRAVWVVFWRDVVD